MSFHPDRITRSNVFPCDGEAAFQTGFHFHLHVIPRYAGDGWSIDPDVEVVRERPLLDQDARAIRSVVAPSEATHP